MKSRKWIGRDRIRCIVLKEKGSKAEEKIRDFVMQSGLNRVVLVVSYEVRLLFSLSFKMYRKYADAINGSKAGLLVCDEGHRLKSSTGNATIDSLLQFPSRRRVLLSGTPIQNDLEVGVDRPPNQQELFALSEFVNPGVFSSLASFRQLFVRPIEAGRRKGCSDADRDLAAMRSAEVRPGRTLIPSSLASPTSLFCVEPRRRFCALRCRPKSRIIYSLRWHPSSASYTKSSSNCSEDRL